MKNILKFINQQFRYTIFNPLWKSSAILIILGLSILTNGLIWYFYLTKFRSTVGPVAIYYSSAVILLNLFLALIIYPKQKLVSFVLIGCILLIQAIIFVFLKISSLTGGF